MAIVRTTTSRILAPYGEAYQAVIAGLNGAGLSIVTSSNPMVAEWKFSMRQNRYKGTVAVSVRSESEATAVADWSVDMFGNKHLQIINEVIAAMPTAVDDLGVDEALQRLGKMGRFFGFWEAAALSRYVHIDERVIELAQGTYGNRQGMLVLTTQRLFFFDKSLLSAKVEEFKFEAVGSLGFGKSLTGEVINISIGGRAAEIRQVAHGRGETFVQAYRGIRAGYEGGFGQPVTRPTDDLTEQIRKLAELRDSGILSEDEFTAKKLDLLNRM